MAYTRSRKKIALGCASTNLAATNFENFVSFHYLFAIPVLEDYEIEEGIQLNCDFKGKEGREELVKAANVILCDEVCNVHKYI